MLGAERAVGLVAISLLVATAGPAATRGRRAAELHPPGARSVPVDGGHAGALIVAARVTAGVGWEGGR
jgi:hypothetical protein